MSGNEWTEEKFKALTLHSADIISLLDGEGRLLFNSPATVRINGFTPEELKDRDTFELIHPEDRERVGKMFADVLATPGAVLSVEYRYLTKDGRWLWMEAVASNQLDNPAVRGVVANSRDISERKKAEHERLRLEQHLLHVQKLESLGVMAGGVAHDFNNLLAVILGEASVLRGAGLGLEANEALRNIETAARSAADLTRQLLAYAGQRTAQLEATNLRALIDELAPLLRASARGDVELRLELADGVPPVRGDRGQLRQVLLNLVLNATEALDGPGVVTVRLSRREVTLDELRGPLTAGFQPGPAVVLEVSDTGKGIPPDALPRIFDPFFSTKATGRGLGLAAVAGILRSHDAGLDVRSEPGRGTTFTLYFPPTKDVPAATPRAAGAKFRGRVLVVDDDALVVRTTARMLRGLGFECTAATSGREAIELFGREPAAWTLVVCDVLMPGLSGPDTVQRLRAARADVPVLFVSGYTADPVSVAEDAHTLFLGKPFDAVSIAQAVRRLCPAAVEQPAP
ncbi:MAG: hybrid sensor histidine kinase/response regulator [Myxococcota bacterium]